ncbi:MAG: Uma2 family endonuclease, partial [Gammaproteobacteria bacterium]
VTKAELIEGIVHMPSPVRYTQHAQPDGIIQGWLHYYAARTPGTQYAPNATVRLDADNVPQPDALLRLLPECGGRTRIDPEGYLTGPPELIVEIAASSVSIDLHDKLRAYRRGGAREYLVWRNLDQQFDWFHLERDEYHPLAPDAQRRLHSPHFPGLTLALDPLLALDSAAVLDVLQAALQAPVHGAFIAQLAQARAKA